MPEGRTGGALARWARENRPAIRFVVGFGLWIGAFALAFQIPWADTYAVIPMTEVLAQVSNVLIRLLGFDTVVTGTIITGGEGFSVNILKGCNGAYVLAIYLSAVLSFPASWREKTLGVLLGIPAVQTVNLGRIVSLYYIGVRHPDLFERFHYHVWQTIVIVLSMALWLLWAECFVRAPRR